MNNKPKALILASVASMIDQFNMENIKLLRDNGYLVDVACNCKDGNTISNDRINELIGILEGWGVKVIHTPIPRKITNISDIQKSITQIKLLCSENNYTLMHCHSPIGSVVARLAAKGSRKKGLKVIYTAHGFHFYKGAPKINWMIFYPIEYLCSFITDILITINREDYEFAIKHMHAKKVEYIPGVGIDVAKFSEEVGDRDEKRHELGITKNDVVLFSVGELNDNKNQKVVLEALSQISGKNVKYLIAGKGKNECELKKMAKELKVNLHLLGYRSDIRELLHYVDIYVFPSFREGLSVSLMEAMASGLPCIVSEIRGNVDLVKENKGGYLCDPSDSSEFANRIQKLSDKDIMRTQFGKFNQEYIKQFDNRYVLEKISEIYFDA